MTRKDKWIMWGIIIGLGLAYLMLAYALCAIMVLMNW